MTYISREALFHAVEEYTMSHPVISDNEMFALFCSIPAADVQEVVLCKDCKFYTTFNNGCNGSCEKRIDSFAAFYPNDFCSYGERKEQT